MAEDIQKRKVVLTIEGEDTEKYKQDLKFTRDLAIEKCGVDWYVRSMVKSFQDSGFTDNDILNGIIRLFNASIRGGVPFDKHLEGEGECAEVDVDTE